MAKEVRITYFSYDDNEILSDRKYDNIEEAEKEIADEYAVGYFNDDKGELSVFVDGEEKDFELFVKIKMEEVK